MEKKNNYGLKWIFEKTRKTGALFWLFVSLVFINNIIMLSLAYFLKLFVDVATGDLDVSLLHIGKLALITAGLGGLLSMLNSVLEKSIQRIMERNLNIELMSVIFTGRNIDISRHYSGELLAKMTADIQAVSNCYVSIARNVAGNAVMAVMAMAGLFYLQWKMALIMLLLLPLMLLLVRYFKLQIEKTNETDMKNDEVIHGVLQESLSRIMLIKTYFIHKNVIEKIGKAFTNRIRTGKKLGAWEGLLYFSGILVSNAMFMIALGVGAYFVAKGETTVGSLIGIVQLLHYVVKSLSSIKNSFSSVSRAVAAAERIGKIYELPPDKEIMTIPVIDAVELAAINVSFSYDNQDNSVNSDEILHKVTARFQKGDITGIVGKNGSGKSTLLKILIGLYPPQTGKVELVHANGVLKGEAILTQVAYVPPADYLFSGTIVDNIVMSGEEIRLDDLKSALNDADIFDFVQSLPDGVDSLIEEDGGNISNCQAQRIAIARAIYKRSPIIVFDEPTTNLDDESIAKFHSTVKKLAQEKICIIVTHDISAVNICDKVYILENGNLVEKYFNHKLKAL